MAKPVQVLQEICPVPGTDEKLIFEADGSSRAADGTRFRAVSGVPILRDEEPPLERAPPAT